MAGADRWVTFDCYGTLIDWEQGLRASLASLWPEVDVSRLLADYHAIEPRIQAGRDIPYREVLARGLRAIAAVEGLELSAGADYALAESLPTWSPFPEVPDTLRALRERGWRLAILSNTDPELLAATVETIGVPFDLTITAAEVRSYKPAVGHWEQFWERTGAQRDDHVHVAASLYHDIEPASRLGLRAIWINRLDETSDLPRLAELPSLLGLPEALDPVTV